MIWLSLLHRIYVNWMCRIFFFRALWAALWRERCCTYPFVRIGSNCVWLWVCSTVAEIKTSLVSTNGSDWLVRFRVWRANVLSPNGSVFSPNELNVFNFKAALISHLAESEPQNWVISTDGALLKRRLPPEKVFEVIKRTHQATIKIINVYTVHTHTQTHKRAANEMETCVAIIRQILLRYVRISYNDIPLYLHRFGCSAVSGDLLTHHPRKQIYQRRVECTHTHSGRSAVAGFTRSDDWHTLISLLQSNNT